MALKQLSTFHIADFMNNATGNGWLIPLTGIQETRQAIAFLTNVTYAAFHVFAVAGGSSRYLNDLFPRCAYIPFMLPADTVCQALEFIPFTESVINNTQLSSLTLFVGGVLREADDTTFVPNPINPGPVVQERVQAIEIPSINLQAIETQNITGGTAGNRPFANAFSGNTLPYGACALYLDAWTVTALPNIGGVNSNWRVELELNVYEMDLAGTTIIFQHPMVICSLTSGAAIATSTTWGHDKFTYFPRNSMLLYFVPQATARNFKLGVNYTNFVINGTGITVVMKHTVQGNFVGGPTFKADLMNLPGVGPSPVLF